MTDNEKIKVLLLGDVKKMIEEGELNDISNLNLLLCSSEYFKTYISAHPEDLTSTDIMLNPSKLLEDLKECLKEEK